MRHGRAEPSSEGQTLSVAPTWRCRLRTDFNKASKSKSISRALARATPWRCVTNSGRRGKSPWSDKPSFSTAVSRSMRWPYSSSSATSEACSTLECTVIQVETRAELVEVPEVGGPTGLDERTQSRLSQGTVAMKVLQPVDGVVQMAEQLRLVPLAEDLRGRARQCVGRCASDLVVVYRSNIGRGAI